MLMILIVFYVVCFREWYNMNSENHTRGTWKIRSHSQKLTIWRKVKKKWLYKKEKKLCFQNLFFTFSELLHFGRPGMDLLVNVNISLHTMNSHALFTYRVVDKPNTTIVIKTLYTARGDSCGMLIKHYQGGRCVFVGQIWIEHLSLFTV